MAAMNQRDFMVNMTLIDKLVVTILVYRILGQVEAFCKTGSQNAGLHEFDSLFCTASPWLYICHWVPVWLKESDCLKDLNPSKAAGNTTGVEGGEGK